MNENANERYDRYRDSGVEWLGSIPAMWEPRRLKYVCRCNPEALTEATDPEWLLRYVDIGNVDSVRGIVSTEEHAFGSSPSRARRVVRDGDVIVSTVRTYLKAIARIENPPSNLVVSTGFAVLRPSPDIDSRFMGYALQASHFLDGVVAHSVGVSYPAINASVLVSFHVVLPSPTEQRVIADFLDRETAHIDSLIEKQEQLITKLEEKRKAMILRAVTRGLNPKARMKESGVEWLGKIPEHWRIVAIGHFSRIGNGSTPLRDRVEYWTEDGYPWLNSSVVNLPVVAEPSGFVTDLALTECHLPKVSPDSVLVALTGEGKTRGMATLLKYEATINQHLAYVTPRRDAVDVAFLRNALTASYDLLRLASAGAGCTKGALTCAMLKRFKIALPPLPEQTSLVQELSERTYHLDKMIGTIEKLVAKLRERRTALISAAVTGRIKVIGQPAVTSRQ